VIRQALGHLAEARRTKTSADLGKQASTGTIPAHDSPLSTAVACLSLQGARARNVGLTGEQRTAGGKKQPEKHLDEHLDEQQQHGKWQCTFTWQRSIS